MYFSDVYKMTYWPSLLEILKMSLLTPSSYVTVRQNEYTNGNHLNRTAGSHKKYSVFLSSTARLLQLYDIKNR